MSFWRIQSKRMWLILVAATAVIWLADAYKTCLGVWGYLIGYPTTLALLIILGIRQQWKDLPPEAQATTQRTMLVPASLGLVCEMVPKAMQNCGWKKKLVDERNGHFEAKIGISRKTYSQIFQVDLTKADEKNTNVSVKCVACHLILDRGQNDKMIRKFSTELERLLVKGLGDPNDCSKTN